MNAIDKIATRTDTRMLLSTLWIVVLISMLKADILSLYIPGALDDVARTAASAGASIPQLMLFGAIMGDIAIVETVCLLLAIWIAWTWRSAEA